MDILRAEHRGLRFSLYRLDADREQFVVERLSDGRILTSRLCDHRERDRFNELVDAWIDERLGTLAPVPVQCAACSAVLEPVLGDDTDHQFDNALWISFSGGYGMFIDPVGGDPSGVICHRCAHQLCDTHPWIAQLLDPQNSHAHRLAKAAEVIAEGHAGWDLQPARLDGGASDDQVTDGKTIARGS